MALRYHAYATRRSLLVPRGPPDVVCERLEVLRDGCKVELIACGAFLQSFRDLTTDLAARMSRSVKIDIKVAVQEVLIQSLGRRLGQDRGALDRTVVYNDVDLDGTILADASGSVEVRLRRRAGQPRICDGPSQLFCLCVVGSRKTAGARARRRWGFFAALQIGLQVHDFRA